MDTQDTATAGSPAYGASDDPRKTVPTYVALGLHHLLALIHGLPDGQAIAWVRLVAEALSDGESTMPVARCREVAGRVWEPLSERLRRSHRIVVEDDFVRLIWVETALADASKRITKARNMRAGHAKIST